MTAVFISHTSGDDALVSVLTKWLLAHGFGDVFVDHDKIRGGDSWRDALRAAKASCRVVLCVVTPRWLSSEECAGEFLAAWYQGKRIIPLLLVANAALDEAQQRRLHRVLGEDQGFDLSGAVHEGRLDLSGEHGFIEPLLAGLRAGGAQTRIGLDPRAFEIEPEVRADPYPGLESFGDEDADAAIFYGRSPEIADCLEVLREKRAQGDGRPLIVLGASGSGKSSLIKAGVLPRLRRERGWIALRSFRPGTAPLFNFADAIARTFQGFGEAIEAQRIWSEAKAKWDGAAKFGSDQTRAGFASHEGQAELAAWCSELFERLRARASKSGATIAVTIDQAEELARATSEECDILLDFVRAITGANANAVTIFTIRSDAFQDVQNSPRFHELEGGAFDVRATPVHRYGEIIEGPAQRYGVEIEPALKEALLQDTPRNEALPLLAFALQRLWPRRAQRRLVLLAYQAFGQLSGLIDDAAESALRGGAPAEPSSGQLRADSENLARQAFVPGLAQINEQGAVVRRVAKLSEFDTDTQLVLDRFVDWRLLVRDSGAEDKTPTLEVAHEALFRHWPRLQRWLEPERAALDMVRDVENAARIWRRHDEAGIYLQHRGLLLASARKLGRRKGYEGRLGQDARAYLDGCAAKQRRFQLIIAGAGAGAAVAALAITGSLDAFAARQRFTAQTQIEATTEGEARTFALAGLAPRGAVFTGRDANAAEAAVDAALGVAIARDLRVERTQRNELEIRPSPLVQPVYMPNFAYAPERWVVTYDHEQGDKVRFFDLEARRGARFETLDQLLAPDDVQIHDAEFSPSGRFVAITAASTTMMLDLESARSTTIATTDPRFAPGSRFVVWRDEAGAIHRLDMLSGDQRVVVQARGPAAIDGFAPNGSTMSARTEEGIVWVDLASGASRFLGLSNTTGFSDDGSVAVTRNGAGPTRLWRFDDAGALTIAPGDPRGDREGSLSRGFDLYGVARALSLDTVSQDDGGAIFHPVLSDDGARAFVIAPDATGMVWDLRARRDLARFAGVAGAALSEDRARVLLRMSSGAALIDLSDGGALYRWQGEIRGVGLSEDGRFGLVRRPDQSAEVFDSVARRVFTIAGANGAARYGFSPDGARIMVISRDGKAKLWDLPRREAVDIPSGQIVTYKFSPDGRWIVMQDLDGAGLAYHVATQSVRELGNLGELRFEDSDYRFSENGAFLFARPDGADDTRVFSVSHDAITETARFPFSQFREMAGGRFVIANNDGATPAVWDLNHPISARGTSFGPEICRASPDGIASFPRSVRESPDNAVGQHLAGRPWHPCDWRGLWTIEGWRQLIRMQAIRWFSAPDYACGEINAAGARSRARQALCQAPRAPRAPDDGRPRFDPNRSSVRF